MRPTQFAERLREVVDPKWIRPAVSGSEIELTERRLGIRISEELRAFYGSVGGADEATPVDNVDGQLPPRLVADSFASFVDAVFCRRPVDLS